MEKRKYIYLDSRNVKKGDFYIALKGKNIDGNKFIKKVIHKKGKILFSDNKKSKYYYPSLKQNLNNILTFEYNFKKKFKLIGITGTNYKTSLSYLLTDALNKNGYKAKCISTIKSSFTYYSSLTTPRNDELFKIFLKANSEDIDVLIMEVSSIGICEFRVNDIQFDYGILTNLEVDHLDYHKTIPNYHLSKIKFLNSCLKSFNGIGKSKDELLYDVLKYFIGFMKAKEYLNEMIDIPGREEIVNNNPLIIIDYAHTISAFEYILQKYSWKKKKRLIVVFGSGGNRDQSKRKSYGNIALKYADIRIVTSDNPRNEKPEKICDQITMSNKKDFITIINREQAIIYSLSILEKHDILLILGKGNEDYQIIKNNKYEFSDRNIIKKYFKTNK